MRVYLTGGSGLLGSHLAERLRARGDQVVCLQRSDSDTAFLREIGCEILEGDVRDDVESLQRGMEGSDVLVHSAALVYVGGPWPRLRAVNVDGTGNAIRAAAAAGLSRAVHLSSVAVYGRRRGAVDEDAPLDTPLEPGELYARSKREAEAAARTAAAAGRIALTIMRPAALYGERDRLLSPRLWSVVRLPVIPLLGQGENALPVVYAGNAAHAVELAVDADGAGGVYNVGMDHRLTQRDLLERLAGARGRRPRFMRLSPASVRQAARLGEALRLNLPGAGDLTVERLARLCLEENPYRTERLRAGLGWEPPFTHEEGIERTAAWLKSRTPLREST